MGHLFLDADWPILSDFTDFCLFSLVTNVMQWLSYLVIAWFYGFQLFSSTGSSVCVGEHVDKFDLHRKVTR